MKTSVNLLDLLLMPPNFYNLDKQLWKNVCFPI